MKRIIQSMEDKYLAPSLNMVRRTFTDSENAEEAEVVVSLIIHLGGKYQDELLILSPVAVKTELQRQHISKELIEYGFEKAKKMGFSAVLVEGNPQNYRSRGFQTSADFGIIAAESVGLPAPECLMVKELQHGALEHVSGAVDYSDYKALR